LKPRAPEIARLVLRVLTVAACLLQAWAGLRVPIGYFKDDALNILLARAVAHGAFALPGGPPLSDPLPGFAFLLALPAALAAPHWELLRWLCLAAGWAAVWLSWRLARRAFGETAALAAAFLVAINPVLIEHSGVVRPDVLFLAVSLLVIDLLAQERLRSAALMTALAALLRPHGALLALAAGSALWLRAGRRPALKFLGTALLPLAAWSVRNLWLAGTATDYASSWALRAGLLHAPSALLRHWEALAVMLFGYGLTGLRSLPGLVAAVGAAFVALSAAGSVRLCRREAGAWSLAAALYAAEVLAVHATWSVPDPRYLIPILPWCWIFMLEATRELWPQRPAAGFALAALLAASALRQDRAIIEDPSRSSARFCPRTMSWIRSETAPGARFESIFDTTIMLLADRPALEPPLAWNRDSWLADCLQQRVEYVHIDGDARRWHSLVPARYAALLELPRWARSTPFARQVYDDPAEGSAVFRIQPPDPRRFLEAWSQYQAALRELFAGGAPPAVRARLEEASRLEPSLALPWALMGHLAADRREKVRCLRKALSLDPSLDAAADELRRMPGRR
jgi:hypothetical protein